MVPGEEAVLLKSTLEVCGQTCAVKLTPSEIYWEAISTNRTTVGPYSEPLVKDSLLFHNSYDCAPSGQHDLVGCEQPLLVEHETVALTSSHRPKCKFLGWKRKTENQTVVLAEVLAVRMESKHGGPAEGKFQNLEMLAAQASSFVLHVVQRAKKHCWRVRKISFHSHDSLVNQQWVTKVNEMISRPGMERPKTLLVLINPISGKRKGPSLYRAKIAPIFDLAGIVSDTIVTHKANYASEKLLECDLTKYDGIVSVGGDGMFLEVVHGLLRKTFRDAGCPDLPSAGQSPLPPALRVGIIPAGSTDTMAYTTNGTNDPVTAALHIVLGDDIAVDVSTVHHGNQFLRYNVSMLGYGYYGDLIADSEHNRWMGPSRYKWSGFKKVLKNRAYEGEVTFVPSRDRDNHPTDATRCRAGCSVCLSVPNGAGQHISSVDGSLVEPEVRKIKGKFLAINNFTISCRCDLAPDGPAPSAHLGDGCSDLVLVNDCSRVQYLRHMMRIPGRGAQQFNFPFVQVFRVKEFQFRPLVDEIDDNPIETDARTESQQRLKMRSVHNSVWSSDGEVVDEPSLDVRVHRQVLRLFARGIEDAMTDDQVTCTSCLKY